MNAELIDTLLRRVPCELKPPGATSSYLDHPVECNRAVEVALVQEHRFAFFWLSWYATRPPNGQPPDLVTIDWHDDVGTTSDFDPAILDSLNLRDANELCMFCWAGLRSLNDGHITPALYLNAFRNVHTVIKQNSDVGDRARSRRDEIVDRYGQRHIIYYHRSTSACLRALRQDGTSRPLVLDLDLDYFTREHPSLELGRNIRLPDRIIRNTLAPNNPFMQEVLRNLAGMTIALEPECCGGIANSLHILSIVNQTLFGGSGFAGRPRWRT